MEFKHLTRKYIYHIEPQPGGGFIARASDPSVPPLEAATREELRQKIQATVFAGLGDEFPGLTLPLKAEGKQFAFHVERNAQGGFDIHSSSDPGASPLTAGTQDEVESHFAEKLIALLGKRFAPELAAQGATGDIKVFVKTTGFTLTAAAKKDAAMPLLGLSTTPDGEGRSAQGGTSAAQLLSTSSVHTNASNPQFSDGPSAGASSADEGPISRQPGNVGNDRWSAAVRFLLALLIVAAVMYFMFLRHR